MYSGRSETGRPLFCEEYVGAGPLAGPFVRIFEVCGAV